MRRWRLRVWAVLAVASGFAAVGCAAHIEAAAAHHQARAVALDAAGADEAALREREAADAERDKLPPSAANTPTPLPALTAF
jgi:hypothetical protein